MAKDKEYKLKLKERHPKQSMRLGRHIIEFGYKKVKLNEAEIKELEAAGGKHWFISKEQEAEAKAKEKKPLEVKNDAKKD